MPTTTSASAQVQRVTEERERAASYRQLFRIACTLAEHAGLPAPRTQRAASELIDTLSTLPSPAAATSDDCPL